MKKIGIITLWGSQDNYGQVLQCFALNRFLRDLGYEAYLVKNIDASRKKILSRLNRWVSYLEKPVNLIHAISLKNRQRKNKLINMAHPRNFDSFCEKYIPSTKVISNADLIKSPLNFDAFICGSDQIWNGLNSVNYLSFAPSSAKKISYASSMGGFRPVGRDLDLFKEYILNFDLISLREKSSVDYLSEKGVQNIFQFPDPSLLLSKNEYSSLFKSNVKRKKPYALLYLLGNKVNFDVEHFYSYAMEKDIDVVYVASQERFDNYCKEYPSIEEWLQLIDGAEMVVTNSFHGMMFSMIFKKKFIVIPLSGNISAMNNRVIDPLKKYNLTDRIYDGGKFNNYEKEPDFSLMEKKLSSEIDFVKQKLIQTING